MRAPDFVIGDPAAPYLRRWWIIPRNKWFNVYLHQMLHDDEDRALHDHPYWNVSVVLKGGYLERIRTTGRDKFGTYHGERFRFRMPGHVILRSPTLSHRLQLVHVKESWSLFITGPRVREWGFHCPKGWIPWTQFVDPANPGQFGPGCGD